MSGHRQVVAGTVLAATAALALTVLAQDGAGGGAEPPEGLLGSVDGEQVYRQVCQGCHMADGRGAQGAGSYPGFVDNPALASADFLAVTILAGRRNMPAFAREAVPQSFYQSTWLSDEQIANVINYLRTRFGEGDAEPVSAARVRALRPKPTEPAGD